MMSKFLYLSFRLTQAESPGKKHANGMYVQYADFTRLANTLLIIVSIQVPHDIMRSVGDSNTTTMESLQLVTFVKHRWSID